LGASILPPGSPMFDFLLEDRVLSWTHASFVARLKSCLTDLGHSANSYSGHSFRRGGCSFCFEAGLDLTAIKLRGDWKTQAYEKYLHVPASIILRSATMLSDFASK
jgi:hypothetical protein